MKARAVEFLLDHAWRMIPSTWTKNRLHILKYHQVLPMGDPICAGTLSSEIFCGQVDWLVKNMTILSATEAFERLENGTLPDRAVLLTFDDGYASNLEYVVPVLQKYGLSGLFFVSSGHLGEHLLWDDRIKWVIRETRQAALDLSSLGLANYSLMDIMQKRHAYEGVCHSLKYMPIKQRQALVSAVESLSGIAPEKRAVMLDEIQVREMISGGMEIGAHTVNHPILKQETLDEARWNIEEDKRRLEQVTGQEVLFFSYPNGTPNQDYDLNHTSMVMAAGFKAAVSTAPGVATSRMDQMQLPRFSLWPYQPEMYPSRIISSYFSTPVFSDQR